MTKEELAEKLNGIKIGTEDDSGFSELAKENNLIIVFGSSDDLCEFRGNIYDEVGCYGGAYILFKKDGEFIDSEEHDSPMATDINLIKAEWCKYPEISWTYETDIPNSKFNIMEGEEIYCRGIVFNYSDLK